VDVIVPGPFSALLSSPAQFAKVAEKFEEVILASFGWEAAKTHSTPTVTRSELKRRFEIVERYFRLFRGELGWSVERSLDHIGPALKSEILIGRSYEPPSNTLWAPVSNE
jgi:hypothetical protein